MVFLKITVFSGYLAILIVPANINFEFIHIFGAENLISVGAHVKLLPHPPWQLAFPIFILGCSRWISIFYLPPVEIYHYAFDLS